MRARHLAAFLVFLAACEGQLPDAVVPSPDDPARLIGAGEAFTCAVTTSGAPYCWGNNTLGQLGAGVPGTADPSFRATPLALPGTPRYQLVGAGGQHACALRDERAVCWGGNISGEIGARVAGESSLPVEVHGTLDFRALSVGLQHTCALTRAGVAYCWGRNNNAELGALEAERCSNPNLESFGCSPVPLRLETGLRFRAVTAGSEHTCALTSAGEAYCWGLNNWGQLGNGTSAPGTSLNATPQRVVGGHRFVALRAGARYTCGLEADGAAYCWGKNDLGQLGDGSLTPSATPVAVAGGLRFASIDLGRSTLATGGFACGITTSGAAYCWGANRRGQLGTTAGTEPCEVNGRTATCATAPVAVGGGLTFRALATGSEHACGIVPDGRIFCWGGNRAGELGVGTTSFGTTVPAPIAGDLRFL